MNKKLIWLVPVVGVLGAVLFGILNGGGGKVAPEAASLKAARGSDGTAFCMGHKKCLVAFVAPWCGYCRRSTPLMQSLLQKHRTGDMAFNVVVTGDETPSMEGYASELGGGAFYDPGTQLATALGVRGFPTWVLFDAAGKPTKTASGAFPTEEQLFSHMGISGS